MEAKVLNTVKLVKRGFLSIAIVAALCVPATASAHILLPEGGDVYATHAEAPSPAAQLTYSRASSGFQWDDAAIGAAGMLGLLAVAGVSSQQVRRRRQTLAS